MKQTAGRNPPGEGLRERKRRETAKRIKETGIRLFIERGYDAATIDDIAAEAGISRRTFFYYYKSKDDILMSLQSALGDILAERLREEPDDKRPLDAVRDAALRVSATVPKDEMLVLDRLMRSSEAVQARKVASYVQHEGTLFAALREKWPEPERETALRLIAMLSFGAVRLSLDAFNREGGKRPLVELLRDAFDVLEAEI
ncbi:helix-turn-helix domain-containing protein [Sphingosinicella sp. LHD-64]|uniref:TetR/AcrR family transcriptional regulator n=1 Tax=Sphingosinicella sp. LHD-64 TaxID=3072139 RepID=UPI00280D65ED|nr:helix-turn-helix domain-containing protein [Sphingosinicella sp. LHD-64]MDQ8758099.1 helix-turn-helix domain-containing protein [Sphingosinicella sp. LHD-64]